MFWRNEEIKCSETDRPTNQPTDRERREVSFPIIGEGHLQIPDSYVKQYECTEDSQALHT